MNFNENFMGVPLSHKFSSYDFVLTVNPTKMNLQVNKLQDQIDNTTPNKNDIKKGSDPILNEVTFAVQVYNSDNIRLSPNVFYPIYLNNNKQGVILEVNQELLDLKNKMFVEIVTCQEQNLIGSTVVQYYDKNGPNYSREESIPPGNGIVELKIDDVSKMVMVKISKDFSDEELFMKVRLRSIKDTEIKLVEKEAQNIGLSSKLEDLSQITNGTKLFSNFVDMPIE